MAVLRDVIAHFAVAVDDKPLTKMDKSLDRLKDKVKSFALGATAAFAVAGVAAYKLVTAASNADESLNVLQQTFKDNSAAVVEWSRTVAREMGRSQYEFQDSVGKFGAFLTPVFKGSQHDIAAMSKSLSELTVDLASFYNTSDAEANMRLFSGMSGETEAVRRYGIDISDSALDAFNAKGGDNRTMRSLSLQEKSLLRFRKIFEDTKLAQGDAVKTADAWANRIRRAESRIKEVAVAMGRKLMPYAKRVLTIFDKFLDIVEKWRLVLDKVKSIFNTILFMGTAYVTVWAILNGEMLAGLGYMIKFAWQQGEMTKKLKTASLHAAAIAISFAAIEDVFSFIGGQKSIIGDAIKGIMGTQNPLARVQRAAQVILGAFKNAFMYARNAVLLILDIPKITKLVAEGKGDDAMNVIANRLDNGIVDVGAEHRAIDKKREEAFQGWVATGGAKGIEGARQKDNGSIDESRGQKEIRFLKERQELIRRGLKMRPDLLGSVNVGTPLGNAKGSDIPITIGADDIQAGMVPGAYLKGGAGDNYRQALTQTEGNMKEGTPYTAGTIFDKKGLPETITFGDIHVNLNGGDINDPVKAAEAFKEGVQRAMSTRKK